MWLAFLLKASLKHRVFQWVMLIHGHHVCSRRVGSRREWSGARDGSDETHGTTHQHHQPTRLLHAERSVTTHRTVGWLATFAEIAIWGKEDKRPRRHRPCWLGSLTTRTSHLRSPGHWFDSLWGRYQVVTTWMADCLRSDKPSWYVTNTKVNSAFHPFRIS